MLELITTFLGGVLLSGLIGLVVWVSSIKKKHIKLSRVTKRNFKEIENKDDELLDMVRHLKNKLKCLSWMFTSMWTISTETPMKGFKM